MFEKLFYLIFFLIGILLFKLLYNREYFINISNNLRLITNKCNNISSINCRKICADKIENKNINCSNSSNIEWSQISIKYKTNDINKNKVLVSRNINFIIKPSNIKSILYFGGTFEQMDEYNNIFCEYKDIKNLKNGTTNGGYFWRNKCMISLINKGYNIIQVPQITKKETNILDNRKTKNSLNCNHNENESDLSYFWYVYNNNTPLYNPKKNNLGERYNKDICGKDNENSPDKDFITEFFNNDMINCIKNKKLFIGGYSGGGYMTGRMIFESIKGNLKWKDETQVNFDGAFILSGTLFHCISPWSLYDQWCPKSNIDQKLYNNTISNNIKESFKDYTSNKINDDFYETENQLKNHPPTIFFSPENDNIVRKELVRYYFNLLNNVSPINKHKLIKPNDSKIKHNWFEKMCDYIDNFFNNI